MIGLRTSCIMITKKNVLMQYNFPEHRSDCIFKRTIGMQREGTICSSK